MDALLLALVLLPQALIDPLPSHGWWCSAGDVAFRVPAAALVLAPGRSVHPELPPADLELTFTARLLVPRDGRYRFALEVEGATAALVVTAGGEDVARLEPTDTDLRGHWTDLARGEAEIRVTFRRHGDAPARLRTRWEEENSPAGGFPPEPLPSFAVRPGPDPAPPPSAAERRARGRDLLATKGCAGCHAPEAPRGVGRRFAPSLAAVGRRFSPHWMRRWIRSPHLSKPGADMPALFAVGDEGDAEVEALVHFLCDRSDDTPALPEGPEGDAIRGRSLYHAVGCVPCHGPLDAPAVVLGDDEMSFDLPAAAVPFPFGEVEGKWRPAGLYAFLREPARWRPDGRMPSLSLTDEEAASITSYLLASWGAAPDEELDVDPALSRRGRRLYAAKSCRSCHDPLGLTLPEPVRPSLDAVGRNPTAGCLDERSGDTPRYELDDEERALLHDALSALELVVAPAAPLAELRRTMEKLACLACHEENGAGGPPAGLAPYFVNPDDRVDLLDEGRFAPDLTGVGFRLTADWIGEALLRGGRARPYLYLRMPQYGEARVGRLVEALPRREGLVPSADLAPPPPSRAGARLGRELVTRARLGCVACHVFRDLPPAGTPGPAFTDFARRIRYEWFRSYLQTPQRFKRGSRMPDFGVGGVSSLTSVLDGDLARQGEALWTYFRLGPAMLPPARPFDPDADGEAVSPPPGAVVLLDGAGLARWMRRDGSDAAWKPVEGAVEVVPGTGDLVSREEFGDALVHVEFRVPLRPEATGQGRGNSGVYLQARYEVQILDSFGLVPGLGDCGAIYGRRVPDRNVCRRPERWQSYDIDFRAPRFDAAGNKTASARLTVWHNGFLIHDDASVDGTTTAGVSGPEVARGPLLLQDRGNPVRYRNVWVLPR